MTGSANLIEAAGGRVRQVQDGTDQAIAALPKVEGGQGKLYLAPETAKIFGAAEEASQKAGDQYVTAERILQAISLTAGNKAYDVLKAAGTKFVIEPYIRFKGQVGEQATMFFMDPCGNALEFKAFANMDQIFAK